MMFSRFSIIGGIAACLCLICTSAEATAEDYHIGLQDVRTRTVIYCYGNSQYSAEDCASYYETLGYTRVRDIPTKTAKYDFLAVDTYPTRRWRNGELTPRW